MDFLEKMHEAPLENQISKTELWKGLPQLTIDETIQLMEMVARNNAIAFDLIGDEWFEVIRTKSGLPDEDTISRAERLKDVWKSETLNSSLFNMVLEARVILLNKVFPKIPKINEIRPIVVTSPLIKFMELRIAHKLKEYMKTRLVRTQTGFVPGMGTEVNITRLLQCLKLRKKRKPIVLFIDFSNAYNTIYHDRLFHILKEKNILDEDEIDFLKGLYSRIKLKMGKSSFTPKRGVM